MRNPVDAKVYYSNCATPKTALKDITIVPLRMEETFSNAKLGRDGQTSEDYLCLDNVAVAKK